MEIIKAIPRSASDILDALVMGRHPFTREPLDADSVFHIPEVIRALLAGKAALHQSSARAQRRALLPERVGQSWTKDEEARLVSGFEAGGTILELAAEHRRTPRAVELRLEVLGKLPTDHRDTKDPTGRQRKSALTEDPFAPTLRKKNGAGAQQAQPGGRAPRRGRARARAHH